MNEKKGLSGGRDASKTENPLGGRHGHEGKANLVRRTVSDALRNLNDLVLTRFDNA